MRGHIRSFSVGDGYRLSGGRVFADLAALSKEPGAPDGMKVDRLGNVYCTGPGGIWIISPAGVVLGQIHMPEVTANLNWGENDQRTLFITASTHIYSLRCTVGG